MIRLAIALVLGSSAAASLAQDVSLPPTFGQADFSRHPPGPNGYLVEVVAGGSYPVSGVAEGCAGFVSASPDFRFAYRSGGQALTIKAIATSSMALLINAPDGTWRCTASAVGDNQQHIATLLDDHPMTGVYDIWVGTAVRGQTADALLSIAERDRPPQAP
jgi:hypothetical protein